MQRKKIYKIGIVVIFLIVLLTPISYLLFGRIENGKVVDNVYKYSGISLLPLSVYPRVQFQYQNKYYIIQGEENQKLLVGDYVEVIFYNWEPQEAKIYSFWGLMSDSLIELPLGLLIWWALFKSFPELYETSISKREYARLLIKGKLKRKESKVSDAPMSARIIIYLLATILSLLLLYGIWAIYREIVNGSFTYQNGIGLIVVIILVLITIIHKVVKG